MCVHMRVCVCVTLHMYPYMFVKVSGGAANLKVSGGAANLFESPQRWAWTCVSLVHVTDVLYTSLVVHTCANLLHCM